MPDKQAQMPPSLPVSNYSSAIARAVEWLGDRYLLAKPINSDMRPQARSALEHPHRVGTLRDVRDVREIAGNLRKGS
jgi:hypothetical protein